jgi:hypothetical protein
LLGVYCVPDILGGVQEENYVMFKAELKSGEWYAWEEENFKK